MKHRDLLQIGDPSALLRLAEDISMLAMHLEDRARPRSGEQRQLREIAERWSSYPIKWSDR